MRKFSMPSIEVRNFSRVSILTASDPSTNMAAAESRTITIGGQSVKLDGTDAAATITRAAMK